MTYLTSVAGGIADGGSTTHDSPTLTVSGTNKVMWVLAGNSDNTPADPSGVAWDPTGVNEALTLQGSGLTFGIYGNATLWRLIAPSDATAKAVRVTWAASKGERYVVVWVENDIDQTTPNGTVASATGTTTAVSAGAVSTSVGQRVLMFSGAVKTGTFSNAAPYGSPTGTERQDGIISGTAYDAFAAQEQTASGTSTTPTWTLVETPDGWGAFAFALNAASSGVSGTFTPTMGRIAAAFSGAVANPGAFAPTMGRLQASFTGIVGDAVTGTFTPTMGRLQASFAGSLIVSATFAPTMGRLQASFAGAVANPGTFTPTMGRLQASFAGVVGDAVAGAFAPTMGRLQAQFSGSVIAPDVDGTFAPTLGRIAAQFQGNVSGGGGSTNRFRTQIGAGQ